MIRMTTSSSIRVKPASSRAGVCKRCNMSRTPRFCGRRRGVDSGSPRSEVLEVRVLSRIRGHQLIWTLVRCRAGTEMDGRPMPRTSARSAGGRCRARRRSARLDDRRCATRPTSPISLQGRSRIRRSRREARLATCSAPRRARSRAARSCRRARGRAASRSARGRAGSRLALGARRALARRQATLARLPSGRRQEAHRAAGGRREQQQHDPVQPRHVLHPRLGAARDGVRARPRPGRRERRRRARGAARRQAREVRARVADRLDEPHDEEADDEAPRRRRAAGPASRTAGSPRGLRGVRAAGRGRAAASPRRLSARGAARGRGYIGRRGGRDQSPGRRASRSPAAARAPPCACTRCAAARSCSRRARSTGRAGRSRSSGRCSAPSARTGSGSRSRSSSSSTRPPGRILVDTGFHASVAGRRALEPRPPPVVGPAGPRGPRRVGARAAARARHRPRRHRHDRHDPPAQRPRQRRDPVPGRDVRRRRRRVGARPARAASPRAIAATHYDQPFDWRTVDYDAAPPYATFERTLDLFGDGSVRLLSTPGHTRATSRSCCGSTAASCC